MVLLNLNFRLILDLASDRFPLWLFYVDKLAQEIAKELEVTPHGKETG